jgi:hypothetical protein
MSETTYTVRYWGGPKDGAEEQITCGYPPSELNGYVCSHSKLGRYFLYSWARRLREREAGR